MLLSYLVLAISVSIDSLGIGITYGLRKTQISTLSKCILFFMSLGITSIAIYLGDLLSHVLPSFLTQSIGVFLLIGMGIWIIRQSLTPSTEKENTQVKKQKGIPKKRLPKTHQFFLKSLGITIQIIRNPSYSDLDGSKQIDSKEALYLGLALSIDSICVGIGSSILGFTSILFPILVAVFQLIFLSFGNRVGKRIAGSSRIPESTWNVISGVLLIIIGISRLFF